ncbi:MAG: hypothetical protein K1566_11200 [Candidatus Thiodiazotropha sp. (ex. Lucinisca nassula)]|nr:hypothetical protein [Candidatus Thiodiazotropha taylori]MBW9256131.1 hypothetical protein [Candidatus Thiodiazotropha sp. (ex. Lucinisca nassula)]MBW9260799.1 hypothetical protein [Candidatus Thiodiazotropha sp. (ex. Lucinisca nassula)]MBW9270197.1 hypothetical protein [Candidatus Thiodiazotropha sp. (ex. Lucinisca nassula)]
MFAIIQHAAAMQKDKLIISGWIAFSLRTLCGDWRSQIQPPTTNNPATERIAAG